MAHIILSVSIYIVLFLLLSYLYIQVSVLKRISTTTFEEFFEIDLENSIHVGQAALSSSRRVVQAVYLLIGSYLWTVISVSAGYIVGDALNQLSIHPLWAIIPYFLFLRFPFGVVQKIIQKKYDLDVINEKIVFSLLMITTFIIMLNRPNLIPSIFTWPLNIFGMIGLS